MIAELRSLGESIMPQTDVLSAPVTDRDGRYRVELPDVEGHIRIDLIRDRCSWGSAFYMIDEDVVKTNTKLIVTLIPDADYCECGDNEHK